MSYALAFLSHNVGVACAKTSSLGSLDLINSFLSYMERKYFNRSCDLFHSIIVKSSQPCEENTKVRLVLPVNDQVELNFKLLHAVAVNDIHR